MGGGFSPRPRPRPPTATPTGGKLCSSRPSKLNCTLVPPPIGLAVSNTDDIVIVNYARDFLHFI